MIEIYPSFLKGVCEIPASKSYSHRAIICGSLSKGKSEIENYLECDDTLETIETLKKFGVKFKKENNKLIIEGKEKFDVDEILIDTIKFSGSTLRFLIPIACTAEIKKQIKFIIKGRLRERPIDELLKSLNELGAKIFKNQYEDFTEILIKSKLKGGITSIPGNISSQFISGLLLACPLIENDTEILITDTLESVPYVEITLDVLNAFGIKIENNNFKKFYIKGNQKHIQKKYKVEGDFSSAAFFLAAGVINGDLIIKNLNINSKQGDRKILEILKQMNGKIEIKDNEIHVEKSSLEGIKIDAKDIPDLVPILSVIGCYAKGETKIYNARRLRTKESDRLSAISNELRKMNADIEELEDGLVIKESKLKGAIIDPHNDHRIGMACAIAGINAKGKTIIENENCVKKSYPNFFNDLKNLIKI